MARCLTASMVLTIFVSLQCAVVARHTLRIINGTNAADGEFPYMVQLITEEGKFICGGSILAPEWILTAAHCIDVWNTTIVYGTNKLYGYQNTTISVKESYQHPNFREDFGAMYDVGVLKLAEPIPFDEKAQPIHLVEANADIPFHVQGVVSGWGLINSFDLPNNLQKLNVSLLTDEECLKIHSDLGVHYFRPIHHLCDNGGNNEGVNYGDSGSPYVINGTQYGIAAWTVVPGKAPGDYSRISNPEYRGWIKNMTNV